MLAPNWLILNFGNLNFAYSSNRTNAKCLKCARLVRQSSIYKPCTPVFSSLSFYTVPLPLQDPQRTTPEPLQFLHCDEEERIVPEVLPVPRHLGHFTEPFPLQAPHLAIRDLLI
jgi:hypothetical protein